ncbi:hypothetical protein V501_01998 [Pseudogymnoascus sp. VKM F-4519 (FW-2642)]|nr:hypothetical protein V501_01998 [Pseudogymnoascus sp. VKM F-4519 (FW-2642)]
MADSTTVDKTAVTLSETPQAPIETSRANSDHNDDTGKEIIKKLLQSQSRHNDGSAKKVGLIFAGLTIAASYSDSVLVKTLPLAIWNTFGTDQVRFLNNLFRVNSKKSKTINLLSDFIGLVKPGEMLFVLGRPGSGCSTFLRAAANQSSLAVSGNLSFAGISHTEFKKKHRRETIYLPEEDRHIASLSVSQTLRFALTMSLPSNFRDSATVDELVITVGKMFGLEHALETPVGGPYSPGVSGGEKKRVSIAEVLAAGSSLQCFDNSTRGLDSSTALDFVKALRTLTDVGQKTTLATLYQAGQSIYNHFDKVILLSEGHQVFFGRANEAEAYFEGLGYVKIPGQTTAEFLTTVTDVTQRRFTLGTAAEQIKTATDLSAAFRSSTIYSRLQREISDYEKAQATESSLLSTSSYNLAFPTQIWECLKREYQLVRAQKMVYYIKWITTVILSLVIGSEYFDLTSDASGAFTRSGIVFYALLFNGWLQFPELFDAHTNRPVLERQASLNMYRPSAVAFARVLIDLPLIAFQHIIFIISFYYFVHLQVDVGKFFFFYLTLFLSTVNFSNLLRMFAYFVPSLDDCFRYGGTACIVCILFAGFLIPPESIRPYFGWLHWINPMFYAYENVFVNEFDGLTLTCDASSLIPNLNSNNIAYQTCSIPGATARQGTVPGIQYANALGFFFDHRWRNIGILIAIAIAYVLIGALGSEIMTFSSQGGAPIIYSKKSTDKKSSSCTQDIEKSAAVSLTEAKEDANSLEKRHNGPALAWKNLTVNIGEAKIIKDVSAYVRPGDFVALCGASGAGKTTLLSALSQTNSVGTLDGEVTFGNTRPGRAFKKTIGFAQQMDLHDGTATIREALVFSALLRQPKTYTNDEKIAYADHVIDMLDLRKYQNALIGDEGSGLGVEIIKRVTIGVELAARPKILFADEPTSGLDSQSAIHIVSLLRNLSQQGQAILVTIHQPSASLFSQFDRLLALSSDGRQLYFGASQDVIPYFEKNGAVCPPDANPAEFILETVGAGINSRTDGVGKGWADTWAQSPEATQIASEIQHLQSEEHAVENFEDDPDSFSTSTARQTLLLTKRILTNQWRNVTYMYSKIWVHVVCGILVGFTFFNVGTSPSELQNRIFSVYFVVFLVNSIVNVILMRFFFARMYWEYREGPSNTYGWVALCSASILAEMPGAILCGTLYYLFWYFPSGLPLGSTAGYIFLFVLTYEVFQVTVGLFMMAMSPDLGAAGNILVFIICTLNWFNGIIVPYNQIQVFWRYWLYYLSPFTYLLGGMATSVISGQAVICSEADLSIFSPPSGQSCGSYAGDWALSASAQLLNPNATSNCQVCKWTTGDQYLEIFNLGSGKLGGIWAYWGIFLAFTLSNVALIYFFFWATKIKHWKLFYFF